MSTNNKKTVGGSGKNPPEMPILTDRDMEILVCSLRSLEGGFPKVDYQALADMMGFKNARSASVSFSQVRKKVLGVETKSTPKKGTPSKRKNATEDGDENKTPSKKSKAGNKGAALKEKDLQDEGEDDADADDEDEDENEGAAFI